MHLASAEQAQRRIIDDHKVCDAIKGLGNPASAQAWAQRFAVLGDPTRLRILLCIRAAGPISVTDLAVAASRYDATASQTLRFLRASGTVATETAGSSATRSPTLPSASYLTTSPSPADQPATSAAGEPSAGSSVEISMPVRADSSLEEMPSTWKPMLTLEVNGSAQPDWFILPITAEPRA